MLYVIFMFLISFLILPASCEKYMCSINGAGDLEILPFKEESSDYDAVAEFTDSMNETGWYQFHVNGTKGKDSKNIMRCAGALEGYLSQERIYQHYKLIYDMNDWDLNLDLPPITKQFLEDNMKYVKHSSEAYVDSKFWNEIGLIYKQFEGMVEGYNLKAPEGQKISELGLWFLQSEGDFFDIQEIYPNDVQEGKVHKNLKRSKYGKVTSGEHCSGLIKLLDDYSDLYFAHDSWSDYRELHGELKEYNLQIPEFKANKIVMSTRIGKLSSFDDFYINDQGLFVLETTINNFNEELYKKVVPQSLFTWIRGVHATWTSDSGKEWTETFIKHNSGTYNNEYLIVDSKQFVEKQKPKSDLLWIIEQYPGTYRSQDITDVLVKQGFFPSFNTPWFEDLYNLAGFPEIVESWGEDGNYWTYNTSARYNLFYREVPRIKTFEQFQDFMRYNNWKRDVYSNGDPGQQIMARYDLRPGIKPHFPAKLFGGLDSKCLKLSEASKGTRMKFHARASPTHDEKNGIPVFQFPSDLPHDGLPDVWNFSWIVFNSNEPDECEYHQNKDDCLKDHRCGYCHDSKKCFYGNKDGPLDGICDAGWIKKSELQSFAKPMVITVSLIAVLFTISIFTMSMVYKRKEETL